MLPLWMALHADDPTVAGMLQSLNQAVRDHRRGTQRPSQVVWANALVVPAVDEGLAPANQASEMAYSLYMNDMGRRIA